ncbi:SDR family NAD(P)-dependent oxidoreductase [Candidatus Micrarchaeota archaeon]|nr:SDR family NAD(P)-dependent oxidoreductase [Candidatus Micrarchaeota archaeon]
MTDETVLVTGGAGFIGSHLVDQLIAEGYNVRVLDNLSRSSKKYVQHHINCGKLEFIDGDVRYEDAIKRAIKGVDYVFHEAAICINRSMYYPKESMDINLAGSQNVFRLALEHGVKRVVFASSASIYGDPTKLPMGEDSEFKPITPYCVSKLASEFLLKFYAREGLEFNVLRYFNVYGLRQKTDAYYTSVIIKFVQNLMHDQPPVIQGDGSQSMDFVNVRDVVRANMLALKSQAKNDFFNVGTGKATSIKELALHIADAMGKKVEPIFSPREVLVKERRAATEKAERMLGFKAQVSIKDGITEVVQDIVKHPELYY